ncbi:hypothetical protein Trydic_g1506 [Trypoxylus dichotomus]
MRFTTKGREKKKQAGEQAGKRANHHTTKRTLHTLHTMESVALVQEEETDSRQKRRRCMRYAPLLKEKKRRPSTSTTRLMNGEYDRIQVVYVLNADEMEMHFGPNRRNCLKTLI